MKTVASWFIFFALCHCDDSIFEKKEAYMEVERFDEMGYIARRQLEYMFDEFARVIENRHADRDAVNDRCIHDERIGNVRAVTECASSVFKDYMGTMIKYNIFKDRYSKRELFKAFRKYLTYMRNHRLFRRDGNIPLADAYHAMLRYYNSCDYLNYYDK